MVKIHKPSCQGPSSIETGVALWNQLKELPQDPPDHPRDVATLEEFVDYAMQFAEPDPQIQATLRVLHDYADRVVRKKVTRFLCLTPAGLPPIAPHV